MTTIQNIPEELLLVIFGNLYERDLIKCQYVCRAWYIPARVKFLNQRIYLKNTSRIKRFITAINRNPNPRFLAAVKELDICYATNWKVTDTTLHKILFRFPNLKTVAINESLLEKFNDNKCEAFLRHCPQLEELTIRNFMPLGITETCKVRLLLTKLNLCFERVDNIEQVVRNFSRIKTLHCSRKYDTFEKILPILANLSTLKSVQLSEFEIDTENRFFERYFQTKTPEERDQALQRISGITELYMDCNKFLSKGALDFIAKYMTGLKVFKISCDLVRAPQYDQLFFTMLASTRSIPQCRYTTGISTNMLWEWLPKFVHQVYNDTEEKQLKLFVTDYHVEVEPQLSICKNTDTSFEIKIAHEDMDDQMWNGTLEMDTFELSLFSYFKKGYMQAYDAFFNTKSTFKKVTLHIPETVLGGGKNPPVARNHTSVKELTIVPASFNPIEPLLNRCQVAFPNLKVLTLGSFSKAWMKDDPKLHLDLAKYTLEKLVVNLSDMHLTIKQKKFTLLTVQVLSLGKTYMYEIPFDTLEPIRIHDQDLNGSVDYVAIHLVVGSLRYLKIGARDWRKLKTKLNVELE